MPESLENPRYLPKTGFRVGRQGQPRFFREWRWADVVRATGHSGFSPKDLASEGAEGAKRDTFYVVRIGEHISYEPDLNCVLSPWILVRRLI